MHSESELRKLWRVCSGSRGELHRLDHRDIVMSLLFLRQASSRGYVKRKAPGVVVPDGCAFDDIRRLAESRSYRDADLAGLLARVFVANGMAPFPAFRKLGQWSRSRFRAVLAALEPDTFSGAGTNDAAETRDVLWALFESEASEKKTTGVYYVPVAVYDIVFGHLLRHCLNKNADIRTICDIRCGDGSLLWRTARTVANKRGVRLYGQAQDEVMATHARLNLAARGYPDAEISAGDAVATFLRPPDLFSDTRHPLIFDLVVANLLSLKHARRRQGAASGLGDLDTSGPHRDVWQAMLGLVYSLKPGGRGACMIPAAAVEAGVGGGFLTRLYQRGEIVEILDLPCTVASPGKASGPSAVILSRPERGAFSEAR
jgi:hypothetical protein